MKMKTLSLIMIVITTFSAIGSVSAQQQGCDSTLTGSPVPAGTLITVSTPSVWDSRSLGIEWDVIDTENGLSVIVYDASGIQVPTYDSPTFSFLAPDAGTYKITLVVNDQEYVDSCMDDTCMSFVTTHTVPCPLCDGEYCEADIPTTGTCSDNPTNPINFAYTGASVPGKALQWLYDSTIFAEGLANVAAVRSPSINWNPIVSNENVGEIHTLTFNVYSPPFTTDQYGHYTGTPESTCTSTVTFVAKPVAQIT